MRELKHIEKPVSEFDIPCACGSGEKNGECCGSVRPCPCGSEKLAGRCCYAPKFDEEEGMNE